MHPSFLGRAFIGSETAPSLRFTAANNAPKAMPAPPRLWLKA